MTEALQVIGWVIIIVLCAPILANAVLKLAILALGQRTEALTNRCACGVFIPVDHCRCVPCAERRWPPSRWEQVECAGDHQLDLLAKAVSRLDGETTVEFRRRVHEDDVLPRRATHQTLTDPTKHDPDKP